MFDEVVLARSASTGLDGECVLPVVKNYETDCLVLRPRSSISRATWLNWREGIQTNFGRPAFAQAWARVKKSTETSFSELRKLEAGAFLDDPRNWVSVWRRLWG